MNASDYTCELELTLRSAGGKVEFNSLRTADRIQHACFVAASTKRFDLHGHVLAEGHEGLLRRRLRPQRLLMLRRLLLSRQHPLRELHQQTHSVVQNPVTSMGNPERH
jgi:hypothetical protein